MAATVSESGANDISGLLSGFGRGAGVEFEDLDNGGAGLVRLFSSATKILPADNMPIINIDNTRKIPKKRTIRVPMA
jgi:hypothetical protein